MIVTNALTKFRIDVDDLPSWEDTDFASSYRAPLCRDYGCSFHALMAGNYTAEGDRDNVSEVGSTAGNAHEIEDVVMAEANGSNHSGANPMASSHSSGYLRPSSIDAMPELVGGHARLENTELTLLPL